MPRSGADAWSPILRWTVSLGLPLLAALIVWLLVTADPIEGGQLLPCLFHQLTAFTASAAARRGLCPPCCAEICRGLFLQRLPADLAAWLAWILLGWWLQAVPGIGFCRGCANRVGC
jgi:hypothetical protein